MKISPCAIALLSSFAVGAFAQTCDNDCYCIPDGGSSCPSLGKRTLTSESDDELDFFADLEVKEASLIKLDPPGCEPYPLTAAALQLTECTGLTPAIQRNEKGKRIKKGKKDKESDPDGPVQCSFEYKGKKGVCGNDSYSIVEQPEGSKQKKRFEKKGVFLTHEGNCGVCSSAQDLAGFLSDTFFEDASACSVLAFVIINTPPKPAAFGRIIPETTQCFKDLGFTDDCARLQAARSINILMELAQVTKSFLGIPGVPSPYPGPASCVACNQDTDCLDNPTPECFQPFLDGTCDYSPCVQCDDEANDEIFLRYGGRSPRNSGIVADDIKWSCDDVANIDQPFASCDESSDSSKSSKSSKSATQAPGDDDDDDNAPVTAAPIAPAIPPAQRPTRAPERADGD